MYFIIFIAMLWIHVSDDFIHQDIIAKLKQKQYWKEYDKMYHNDWIPALILHACKWSISIHVPIIIYYIIYHNMLDFVLFDQKIFSILVTTLIINAIAHVIIDHLKCNLFKMNLIQDQICHIVQILLTLSIHYELF